MKKMIFVAVVLIQTSSIFADQCQALSKEEATKAFEVLKVSRDVKFFCEPCGDTEPTQLDVKAIAFNSSFSKYYEVRVNNEAIDLAYTYVDGVNLASYTTCPTQGVSPEI